MAYSDDLKQLIQAALADGFISDKERNVLHKRAIAEGVDPDELDVYVDGELQRRIQEKARNSKFGSIRKCPNCGATVDPSLAVCPVCGYSFTGIGPNKSMEKLSEQIAEINKGRKRSFWDSVEPDVAVVSAIENFPVPNTKEDLVEFISSLSAKSIEGLYASAYRKKLDECLEKAKLSFPNDPAINQLMRNHKFKEEQEEEKQKKFDRQYWLLMIGLAALTVFGFIALAILKSLGIPIE